MPPAYQTLQVRRRRGIITDVGDDDAGTSATCVWCGVTADGPPLTWTIQFGERGVEHLCERCTRENARKIEGSLPTEWW